MKIIAVSIGTAVAFLGGAALSPGAGNATMDVEALLLASASTPLANAACGACAYCAPFGGQTRVETVESPNLDYLDHPCDFGETCFMPECPPGEEEEFAFEDAERAWTIATSGTADQVTALALAYPKHVKVNAERASVQLFSCAGLMGNVPLSDEVAADLGLSAQ